MAPAILCFHFGVEPLAGQGHLFARGLQLRVPAAGPDADVPGRQGGAVDPALLTFGGDLAPIPLLLLDVDLVAVVQHPDHRPEERGGGTQLPIPHLDTHAARSRPGRRNDQQHQGHAQHYPPSNHSLSSIALKTWFLSNRPSLNRL